MHYESVSGLSRKPGKLSASIGVSDGKTQRQTMTSKSPP